MPTRSEGREKKESAAAVGDTVSLMSGTEVLQGVVIEDRGRIGPHDQHVYRVEVASTAAEPIVFEVPAALILPSKVVKAPQRPAHRPRRRSALTRLVTRGSEQGRVIEE